MRLLRLFHLTRWANRNDPAFAWLLLFGLILPACGYYSAKRSMRSIMGSIQSHLILAVISIEIDSSK